jgi:hypothetical protein
MIGIGFADRGTVAAKVVSESEEIELKVVRDQAEEAA